MKMISYLATNGVGADRFKDTKVITPHDLFLSTLVNEEGEPVAPEYPDITYTMMFNEYKQEPVKFMWALIKTPFRAIMWFIQNVFMRLLRVGFMWALLTVIYQTAIGKTFSEATILHEFWRLMVSWMILFGAVFAMLWFMVLILRMNNTCTDYSPRWKHELWVPPFIVLWELHNGELVAHHYKADMKDLSSKDYVQFKNMTYENRFVLGYMNGLINVYWRMTSIVVYEVGEVDREVPDMLYLTELSLATYDLNNVDQRARLEKERVAYQHETML